MVAIFKFIIRKTKLLLLICLRLNNQLIRDSNICRPSYNPKLKRKRFHININLQKCKPESKKGRLNFIN